jgi:5-methylcytosine-specific restriction endonuclease McrA
MLCGYCEEEGHSAFNCRRMPRKRLVSRTQLRPKKHMNKMGKVTKKWFDVRDKWLEQNKAEFYVCHYCPTVMTRSQLTLDHYKSRGRHPELRYVLKNLVPCCSPCNTDKGSRDGDEYIELLKERKREYEQS